jgi:hypothetical protein
MLILTAATDAIEIVLGAASAAPLPCIASYRTIDGTTYVPGRVAVNSNGVTTVPIVAGIASFQRVIDYISIYNPNAAAADVTVKLDLNGTEFVMTRVTLSQGERLEYQDGLGWSCYASTGAQKHSLNQGANAVSSGDNIAVLAANVFNSNAVANSIADITGLSFPVVSGTRYEFEFRISYSVAATTTGARFSINGPAFSSLVYDSDVALGSTSETINRSQVAYDLPAAANGSAPSTLINQAWVYGVIVPSADGIVIARFASEVASSAVTALIGSRVKWRAL